MQWSNARCTDAKRRQNAAVQRSQGQPGTPNAGSLGSQGCRFIEKDLLQERLYCTLPTCNDLRTRHGAAKHETTTTTVQVSDRGRARCPASPCVPKSFSAHEGAPSRRAKQQHQRAGLQPQRSTIPTKMHLASAGGSDGRFCDSEFRSCNTTTEGCCLQ